MSVSTEPSNRSIPPGPGRYWPFFERLGIRHSLVLGFSAMSLVMLVCTLGALAFSHKLGASVGTILEDQLPRTVTTLRFTQSADALAASGTPLAFVQTRSDRDLVFQDIAEAHAALQSFRQEPGVEGYPGPSQAQLTEQLTDNLTHLMEMVEQRLELREEQELLRTRLLANLQAFQRHLAYRSRILEGDGAVIARLAAQPEPPYRQIAEMALNVAGELPISSFYTQIETINGRLLAAMRDPGLTATRQSRQVLKAALSQTAGSLENLPQPFLSLLEPLFLELNTLALAENGLITLRERELRLQQESRSLNKQNRTIVQEFNNEMGALVRNQLEVINKAGIAASDQRRQLMTVLVLITAAGLLIVAILMYFHVDRHVLSRLTWLSTAMQDIAAGRFDGTLPPTGDNELGRLGQALHQFRTMAVAARERELALQTKQQKTARTLTVLETARREQEQLLQMIGHEVRTPISIINAAIESLELMENHSTTGPDSQKSLRYQRIHRAIDRMRILMELVDADQKGALDREESLSFQPLQLAHLCRSSLDLVAGSEDRIDLQCCDGQDLLIRGDERRLAFVLLNLYDNAIKYALNQGRAKGTLTLEWRNRQEGVCFSLCNPSRPLAPGMEERIFEKYDRIDEHRNPPGLGLGLYLARRIAEQHQGSLTARNSGNGQVCFDLWLPLYRED